MTNVVIFKQKANLTAQKVLADFIDFVKTQVHMFGQELNFESDEWNITAYVSSRNKGTNNVNIKFTKFREPDSLNTGYKDFAKAYFRYIFALRPLKNVASILLTLRLLEKALLQTKSNGNVTLIDTEVLNTACSIAETTLGSESAYLTGVQLEKIHQFLIEHNLCVTPFKWLNHIKPPGRLLKRVGKDFDATRASKLPDKEALEALPKAFHLAQTDSDIIATSVGAILCSAPDRINEVLILPVLCEVNQPQKDKTTAYGLRWWPAKGADPMIKWILPSMSGVVTTAIAKIKKATEQARLVAACYDKNANAIYLDPAYESLRTQQYVNMRELESILWSDGYKKGRALKWCSWHKLDITMMANKAHVLFTDVEKLVLAMLPKGFPFVSTEVNLRYKDALFITLENQLHDTLSTYRCMVAPVSYHQINIRFGNRESDSKKSMFTKLGLFGEGGRKLSISTHQFRHYLNTLAQVGGLSQLDIAKWSGRKDIHQNQVYDHETSEQLITRIRNALVDTSDIFNTPTSKAKIIPIRRDEFARLVVPTAHTTEYGYCIHDYTMSPCTEHMACLKCQELVCVKGDSQKKDNLEKLLAEHTMLMDKAVQAVDEGLSGAEQWLTRHKKNVEHITQLVALLNNKDIPDGSVIQLVTPLETKTIDAPDLNKMRGLLNNLKE